MRLRLICWKSFFGALSALTALVPAFGQSLQFAAPEAKTNYDLAGKPFPVWSGGALLDDCSLNNYTTIVAFILYFQRNTTGAALISSKYW